MNSKESTRKSSFQTLKSLIKIYGMGGVFALLIMAIAYQFVEPSPPYSLTIATASKEGAYYKFALKYKKLFAEKKIELKILETSGSVENLEILHTKKADVAFIQGGIASAHAYPDLRGLASLYLEPVLIFSRKDSGIQVLNQLRGKRVAIGPVGSGTRAIALQVLADNELNDSNIEMLDLSGKDAVQALITGTIDSFFTVTQVQSQVVTDLYQHKDIQLLNLKRAEAYSKLHGFLSHIVLPQGVLDLADNIPSEDLHFIAPSATLAIHQDLHPALIDILMQISTEVHQSDSLFSENNTFPSPDNLDLPLSKEAERFYKNGPSFLQRYLPFWAATLIDRLKVMLLPLIALIIPLAKILPPTYRWRIRSRIYRWYDELHTLDLNARSEGSSKAIKISLEKLTIIELEVQQIEVPLSYAEELYNLRQHLDLLKRQLKEFLVDTEASKS